MLRPPPVLGRVRVFQEIMCIFLFLKSGSPYKASYDSVNMVQDTLRNVDVLHNMIGNAAKGSFSDGGSTSHIEELSFPISKFGIEGVNDEVKVSITGFGVENRESQISTQFSFRFNLEKVRKLAL